VSERDAPIELVAYDARWPAEFERERALLAELIGPWLVGSIEHIGSTAVPGLVAKPVIDIMAPVQDLAASRPALEPLARARYCYYPYRGDVMHWFCKPSPAWRTHHLHLVPHDGALWRERLTFRDALRGDAALAAEYAALKGVLAARYPEDRDAYTDAKRPFVSRGRRRVPT
jgi:GrpB-like predicted nucleotidyltransferase (UPF0157 family)